MDSNLTANGSASLLLVSGGVSPEFARFTGIFMVILSITGVTGNIVVLGEFLTHKSLRTKANYFIASLSVSDLIASAVVIPLETESVFKNMEWTHGITLCEFQNTLFYLIMPSSLLNLFGISVYRYLTIAFPYKGNQIRLRYVIGFILGLWTYSLITALLPVLGWRPVSTFIVRRECYFTFAIEWSLFMLICNFFIPSFIMLSLYALIFRIAKRHANRIEKTSQLAHPHRASGTSFLARLKAVKTLSLLVGLYLACWCPYMVLVLIYHMCRRCAINTPRPLHVIFVLLSYSNTSANPFLFAVICPDFRMILLNRIKKMFGTKQFSELPSVLTPRIRTSLPNTNTTVKP